jgi:hypothetical protein
MKLLAFVLFAMLLISCKKEKDSFISRYESIYGTWNTELVSYDSSGVRVTRSSQFDKLVIDNNLEYHLFLDLVNPVENGTINIITQTNEKLEVYFDAKYPLYSSFIGSHLFGVVNVILVSLTDYEMVLKTVDSVFFPTMEFHFKK